ncbi:hypothetical protein D9619_006728 [Psilocybe cf. subviscida]|uniref:Uncharacterized protein n=1 Tax=Psilocybe cf. subviscida TaxID=2480587 RepID=A0A8H5EXX3_9AGAR|nr:hypothetical protein D9619_006728 [Psilocybe cf. subviscida]
MSDNDLPPARRRELDALLALLTQQLLPHSMLTAMQKLSLVHDFLLTNRERVLAILTAAGGVAVLVPAILSVIGFTSSGVLAGSLAALIQSVFYGANTGGIFSLFQSIGATAALAPPVAFVLGGALLIGAGWLWWYRERDTAQLPGGNDDDDNDVGGSSGGNGGGAGGGGKGGGGDAADDKEPAPETMAVVKQVRMRSNLTNARISVQVASLLCTLSTTDEEEEEEKGEGQERK